MSGDPYLVDRIVGNHEYRQSLGYLTDFVSSATEDEIKAADEIIEEEPQYIVYSLAGANKAGSANYDHTPTLARLMGLARVELAAIVAGFTKHPSPFEAVRATEFEMDEFRGFIEEGAFLQFEALQNDGLVLPQSPPTTFTLAYTKRLDIARHFVNAAIIVSQQKQLAQTAVLNRGQDKAQEAPPQVANAASQELWPMKVTVDGAYRKFYMTIFTYLRAIQQQAGQRNEMVERYIRYCRDGVCRDLPDMEGTTIKMKR